MSTDTKPAFFETLNGISLGETGAGVLLNAWADATPNAVLEEALRLVAARETSHGDVFCRRLAELGCELEPKHDPEAVKRIAKYGSPRVSDIEKIGPRNDGSAVETFFVGLEKQCDDGEFDPLTTSLVRWYVAEERSSVALLNDVYEPIRAEAEAATPAANAGSDAQAVMACMTSGFDRLENAIMELARASTATAPAGNGVRV